MGIYKSLNNTQLFNLAQYLYSNYNILKTDEMLEDDLNSFLNKENIFSNIKSNCRKIYNEFITKYYPNEISIKSAFIKKNIMKTSNHVTVFELNSNKSRLDLCKVNGHSIAYEIKTDLDSLERLEKQLNSYQELYDKVFVICSVKREKEIVKLLPQGCGLYTYKQLKNGSYTFKLAKKARLSNLINPIKQLNLFTKKEINKLVKATVDQSKEEIITFLTKKYSKEEINLMFKKYIKQKYSNNWKFLQQNIDNIYEIDYQWFFQNNILPKIIYKETKL